MLLFIASIIDGVLVAVVGLLLLLAAAGARLAQDSMIAAMTTALESETDIVISSLSPDALSIIHTSLVTQVNNQAQFFSTFGICLLSSVIAYIFIAIGIKSKNRLMTQFYFITLITSVIGYLIYAFVESIWLMLPVIYYIFITRIGYLTLQEKELQKK